MIKIAVTMMEIRMVMGVEWNKDDKKWRNFHLDVVDVAT